MARTFMGTEIEMLAIGDWLLQKRRQDKSRAERYAVPAWLC